MDWFWTIINNVTSHISDFPYSASFFYGMLVFVGLWCLYALIKNFAKDRYNYPYRAIEVRTSITDVESGNADITSKFYPERLCWGLFIDYRIERFITICLTLKPAGPFESESDCRKWVRATWAPRRTIEIVKHRMTGL